jgi:hypothetical protein
MTGPINIETIIPTKYKAIVGLIGSLLSFVVPYVVQVEQYLPSPWPVVIGAVIAGLTFLGIVKAPYVPQGAVLAPDTPQVAVAAQAAVTQSAVQQASVPQAGIYPDPWP